MSVDESCERDDEADRHRPPPCPVSAGDLPRHIAIIMDGNGRWARARGLPVRKGHEAGADSVREVVELCGAWGVGVLTLYAFSSENWNRPRAEVAALMRLLQRFLKREADELMEKNVRLRAIGDLERLPAGPRRELDRARARTAGNTGLTLVLALSYGARDEIVRAVRTLARRCAAGELAPGEIDEAALSDELDTAGLPDPDLLIRTAGELRLSNFLLWQLSYSEYYASEILWPDFREPHLAEALRNYAGRRRTFGRRADAPGETADPSSETSAC
jgi:undecaprenyl diphosphate synthase